MKKFIFLTLLLLYGCQATPPASFNGDWLLACHELLINNVPSGVFQTSTWSFQDGSLFNSTASFTDSFCTQPSGNVSYQGGSYAIQENVITLSGVTAQRVNFVIENLYSPETFFAVDFLLYRDNNSLHLSVWNANGSNDISAEPLSLVE